MRWLRRIRGPLAAVTLAIGLMGTQSLPIAVVVYLLIAMSATMFAGDLRRWLVDQRLSPIERGGRN